MPDLITGDLSVPVTAFGHPNALSIPVDETLQADAIARWHESRLIVLELFDQAPDATTSLHSLIRQQLDVDGDSVTLRSATWTVDLLTALLGTWARTETIILPADCQLEGVPPGSKLAGSTPQQLLKTLQGLPMRSFLRDQWNDYWSARAPGTALSRQALLAEHSRSLLHAASQGQLAVQALQEAQLQALRALLDAGGETPLVDREQVYVERIALVPPSGPLRKLPGALVLTTDALPSLQLLFTRNQSPFLQLFNDRRSMEAYLIVNKQALWTDSLGAFHVHDRIGLTPQSKWLDSAFTDELAALLDDQLDHLTHTGAATWHENGAAALRTLLRVDARRHDQSLVGSPAMADTTPSSRYEPLTTPQFGKLYVSTAPPVRCALIEYQLDAFEKRLGSEFIAHVNDPQWVTLKACFEHRAQALETSILAARALLGADTVATVQGLSQRDGDQHVALLKARKEGLRLENQIQYTLGQIGEAAHRALDTVCAETPDPESTAIGAWSAATLSLCLSERSGNDTTLRTKLLEGSWVLAPNAALKDASAPGEWLLICPGSAGGLQRLSSRKALEDLLLVPGDADMTLLLTPVATDIMAFTLRAQLLHWEVQALAALNSTGTADQRLQTLAQLAVETAQALQVSEHDARDAAHAHLLNQHRSSDLHTRLPQWLTHLNPAQRTRFKTLIDNQLQAVERAQALQAREIPDRSGFFRLRLLQRLREDFQVEGDYDVSIDVPQKVTHEHQWIAGPANAQRPGPVLKPVVLPSSARERIALHDLALQNIDQSMSERLDYQVVSVTGGTAQGRRKIIAGVDKRYLRDTLADLDLPRRYAERIRDTYMGRDTEPVMHSEYRRECLLEPVRQMLRLQSLLACAQGNLDETAQAILEAAIDGNSTVTRHIDGRQIALRPAKLSQGGSDTQGRSSTLSGITFISDDLSGTTLLYLPEYPMRKCLRQYPTLEDARLGLFGMLADPLFAAYLAGRTLRGSVQAQDERVRVAWHQRDNSMIQTGIAWPLSTSLARHLVDAQMGRLLEDHSQTSRSEQQLYFEQFAADSQNVFVYTKLVLSFLPISGMVVDAYDTWHAARDAVAAFKHGDTREGMQQLKSIMWSLTGALMDFAPGISAHQALGLSKARTLMHLRSNLGHLARPSSSASQRKAKRFAGYEYTQAITFTPSQPASQGRYCNVYRHAAGDFIRSQGNLYKVQWDADHHTWRLQASGSKTYRQPIALDEAGEWNTHGAVYGTLIKHGLAGGGAVLSRVADTAEPFWPASVRNHLPDWLANRANHRRTALKASIDAEHLALLDQVNGHVELLRDYTVGSSAHAEVDAACVKDIQAAIKHYQQLQIQAPLLLRGNLRQNRLRQDIAVDIITSRIAMQMEHAVKKANALIRRLIEDGHTPGTIISVTDAYNRQMRATRRQIIKYLDDVDRLMVNLKEWTSRTTEASSIARNRSNIETFSTFELKFAKAAQLAPLLHGTPVVTDVAGILHLHQIAEVRTPFHASLASQKELASAQANVPQRRQVLECALRNYHRYRSELRIQTRLAPEQFDLDMLPGVYRLLEEVTEHANQHLARLGAAQLPTSKPRPSKVRGRVFETIDNNFYVGYETAGNVEQPRSFTTEGSGGMSERWIEAGNNRWTLANPRPRLPAQLPSLNKVVEEARTFLAQTDAKVQKIERAAGWSAKDIEDTLQSHAQLLQLRADSIARQAPQRPLVKQLRDKARQLILKGREQHIRARLAQSEPQAGDLDYLLDQGSVELVKINGLTELAPHAGAGKDYLLEYEVRNLTVQPPTPLWYVHFHYKQAKPAFASFAKAHIKLAEQRHLGLRWQQAQPQGAVAIHRGDINRAMAEKHFKGLID